MPLARDVVRDLAAEHGGCIRPVQFGNWEGGLMAGQRDELLTVAQVLAVLGDVSPRTFCRWR